MGRKETTYHSVGEVAEVLDQHLLDHVRLRDNDKHPTAKIVPGRNERIIYNVLCLPIHVILAIKSLRRLRAKGGR